jgi:hypothetical protein
MIEDVSAGLDAVPVTVVLGDRHQRTIRSVVCAPLRRLRCAAELVNVVPAAAMSYKRPEQTLK